MRTKIIIFIFCIAVSITSCTSFKDAGDAKEISPISITVTAVSALPVVASVEGLTVTIYNPEEEISISKVLMGSSVTIDNLIPGRYMISVGGTKKGTDDNLYKLNETKSSISLFKDGETIEFNLPGIMFSPLIFKEIYYSGSKKGTANYFMDQFYEIYNNSDNTIYLDGMFICDLVPQRAPANPPVWDADASKNVFAQWVFQMPGGGTEYPLQPGESCVFASSAVNHNIELFNPDIELDLHNAEFEFFMGHNNGDQPAPNMKLFHFGGSPSGIPGSAVKQFLSSVFGGAYAIFKVPEGIDWNPKHENWYAKLGVLKNIYARIPIEWVLDAVECCLNQQEITRKRIPGVLDEGMAYVGSTYAYKSIARRQSGMVNINGDPVYVDDNNSSTDFLIDINDPSQGYGRQPVVRRYGAKMPSWNFSLK